MRPTSHLRFRIVIILFILTLRTACHPRPVATSSLATTADLEQDSHNIHVTTAPGSSSVENTAENSLSRRNMGFQHYLDIGSGWNMYYSSWPSVALPIRKYHFDGILNCSGSNTPSSGRYFGTRDPYSTLGRNFSISSYDRGKVC